MKGATFLFPALFKTLILPPLLARICLSILCIQWALVDATVYVASFPAVYIFRSHLAEWRCKREAARIGGRDIPRVQGRLPLNVDVLLEWGRASREEVGYIVGWLGVLGKTLNTRVLGEDQIISTDPRVFKHCLMDEFDNFVKGDKFRERALDFLGDGIFNSDGERWKFHRALLRPFFHARHTAPERFIPTVDRFIHSLPRDTAFDFQRLSGNFTLVVSILWLCGEDIQASQSGPGFGPEWEAARKRLGWALVEAQRVVGTRVKTGTIWPLLELGRNPLEEPMRVLGTFFRPLVHDALSRKEHGQPRPHVIDRLVDVTDDFKLVEDQLINLLLAARDTSRSLLTFLIYALALHPEVKERLAKEVKNVFGQGPVTREGIQDLGLARAFINETLRLFPPVPLNIRRSLGASLLPTSDGGPPLYMPANTSIILATVSMQRDPANWGPDALDFNIDRWLGSDTDRPRENLAGWHLGPRTCLGQPFALSLLHTFLAMFLRQVEIVDLAMDAWPAGTAMPVEWLDPAKGGGRARSGRDRVWIVSEVVLAVKGGLWVRIKDK